MDVKLPKLGEGSESGTVVSVLVKVGDVVARGQTILELENEKAVAPIPSTASSFALISWAFSFGIGCSQVGQVSRRA